MKFSIVTPTYNSEKFLSNTITSVLTQQGDFEIEYIVVDGASTDNTVNILHSFKKQVDSNEFKISCKKITMKIVSEKDAGMYDAIQKGFSMASGEIFAWINSDDFYENNAFEKMNLIFKTSKEIKWVKGITTVIQLDGKLSINPCYIYNQKWVEHGLYGTYCYFIHQDSVFWRKELWHKIDKVPQSIKYAGDYIIWKNMAKYEKLWSLNERISVFRKRENQLSSNRDQYLEEQLKYFKPKGILPRLVKLFFYFKNKVPKALHLLAYRLLFINREKKYINIQNGNILIAEAYSYEI